MRFEVSVFPGYNRYKMLVPNVQMESGFFPWNINTEMSQITYRYELAWKDRVYVDVTYSILDSSKVLVAMNCVNNTELEQTLQLNFISNIDYPDHYPSVKAEIPEGGVWLNTRDYKGLTYARPRHNSNLVFDGWMRAETHGSEYIDAYAIGKGFGSDKNQNDPTMQNPKQLQDKLLTQKLKY